MFNSFLLKYGSCFSIYSELKTRPFVSFNQLSSH